jgi:hypothetical protein
MEAYPHKDAWAQAEEGLAQGAEGRTVKMTIGDHDIYAKVGFVADRPVYIDITIGHGREGNGYTSPLANELATQLVDDARAQLEVICRQASTLLQIGAWDLGDITAAWRGTKFEPSGVCPQVQGLVSSPLDAIARYLGARMETGAWLPQSAR